MNDLEYVRRSLSLLPDELQIEAVLEAVRATGDHSSQWRDNIQALLDSATSQLHTDIMLIINRIGVKVCKRILNYNLYKLNISYENHSEGKLHLTANWVELSMQSQLHSV